MHLYDPGQCVSKDREILGTDRRPNGRAVSIYVAWKDPVGTL